MKKLFVFSDTHRNINLIKSVLTVMKECDLVIHLGDYVCDTDFLRPELGEKLINVRGNGDLRFSVPDEREIEADCVKIFLTHGHRYNVKRTLVNLGNETLSRECAIALYGHTHRADIADYCGVKLINPGSFFAPWTGVPSYCYIVIWKDKIVPRIVEI